MGTFLDSTDLPSGTGSNVGLTPDQMIEDAEALALLAAPCLGDEDSTLTAGQVAGVKAILRGAIMRWSDAGSGARQSVSTGPFSETIDTSVSRRGMFWPSEITDLQGICPSSTGSVYSLDLSGPTSGDGYWSAPNAWTPL